MKPKALSEQDRAPCPMWFIFSWVAGCRAPRALELRFNYEGLVLG